MNVLAKKTLKNLKLSLVIGLFFQSLSLSYKLSLKIFYKNNMDKNNIGIVILAAGKGTRLGCTDKPKVMLDIGGKPMMSYIVSSLESLGVSSERIMAVVGFQRETIINYFGSRVNYAVQEEQLGTAHAAMVGAAALPETIETVCVLQGDDSAFLSPQTLNNFLETHI